MTKEEAIDQLQDAKSGYKEYLSGEALDMAIKALEQEPILDKIKAEIKNYKLSEDEFTEMDEDSVKWGMKIAYDIIDKYKAGGKA